MTLLPLKLLNLISSLFLLSLDLSYTETLSISVVQLWVVPTPPNWNWLLQIPPSSMTPRTPFLLESHLIWILGWSNEKLYGPMHVQLKGFPQMAFLSIVLEVLITGLVGALNVDTQPGPQSICRYGPVLLKPPHNRHSTFLNPSFHKWSKVMTYMLRENQRQIREVTKKVQDQMASWVNSTIHLKKS